MISMEKGLIFWICLGFQMNLGLADEPKETAVVELLIVCDTKFAALFKQPGIPLNLSDFWPNEIRVNNHKFRTLVESKVFIRVVDIMYMTKAEEQEFLKNVKPTRDWSAQLLENLSRWLYKKWDSLDPFDAAILATGLIPPWNLPLVANNASVCVIDDVMKLHKSTAIVFYQDVHILNHRKDIIASCNLANAIAAILAGPLENTEWCYFGSRKRSDIWKSQKRLYFSKLTDVKISSNLKHNRSQCVFNLSPQTVSNITCSPLQYVWSYNFFGLNTICQKIFKLFN